MAENSKIEWTDHTFNPWIGCTRVSPGCVHCYAEEMMDHRYGKVKWGPQGMRVRTSKGYWKKPLKWNKEEWVECEMCGWRGELFDGSFTHAHSGWLKPTRQRVFCASLADVGDHHPSVSNEWVEDLVRLTYETRHVDWLFLTKRMEDVIARFSMFWGSGAAAPWPDNVWVGVSVESQKEANERIPLLVSSPARVKFLSCEPMLGPIDLSGAMAPVRHGAIDWVICGGESGAGCRPMNADWARDLQKDCQMLDIKFFMKQLGGYPNKRDQLLDLPEDLRIREWPNPQDTLRYV